MDIYKIVMKAGLSDRPSFYSGRGATLTDLNSKKLQTVHDLIKNYHGEEAAKEYIQMVDEMEVMSATGFLNTVYALARNSFKFDPRMVDKKGISMDSEGSALGTLLATVSRGSRDDSDAIKIPFLKEMGLDVRAYMKNDGRGRYYRDSEGMVYHRY